MLKTILAASLMTGVAGMAQADSSVTVYGNVDVGVIKRTGTSFNIGKRANNTLGFKGTEELGAGLKAVFQLEMRYEPDTGTSETGAGGVQRPLFQGSSRVGLAGDWGTLRIGRGLTAFQESSIAFEPWHGVPSPAGFQTDLMVGGYTSDPLGQPGNSTNRFGNAAFYNSPEWSGFQLNLTIGSKESLQGSVAVPPLYPSGAPASANPFSLTTTYKNGPIAAMLAVERNAVESKLYSIAGSVDAGAMVSGLKLMASYIRQDQAHTLGPAFNETKSWVLGANWALGPGKFLAGYGQKSPEGVIKTKQFSLGYEYSLSKRTYVYFDASNKKGTTVPDSINHYAIGVNHAF
jgi:predicted porin